MLRLRQSRPKTNLSLQWSLFAPSRPLSRHANRFKRRKKIYSQIRDDQFARARANYIIHAVQRRLASKKPETAYGWLRTKLSEEKFQSHIGSQLLEGAIMLFWRYCRFAESVDLCQRVQAEGYMPSMRLQCKILVFRLATLTTDEKVFLDALKDVFEMELLQECDIEDLVHFLDSSTKFPSTFCIKIIDEYFKSRGPGSKPSSRLACVIFELHWKSGLKAEEGNMLDILKNEARRRKRPPGVHPYAALLAKRARDGDTAGMETVLKRMEADEVAPNIAVFNTILATELRRRRFESVFETYNALLNVQSDRLVPRAFTFRAIFQALHSAQQHSRLRRLRSRDAGLPSNAPEAREVYRHMMTCYFAKKSSHPILFFLPTSSPIMTVDTLKAALKLFMFTRDYPAAYVVLQTFKSRGFYVDVEMFRIIALSFLARIQRDIRIVSRSPSPSLVHPWSREFLGRDFNATVDNSSSDYELLDLLARMADPPKHTRSGRRSAHAIDSLPLPSAGDEKGRKAQLDFATMDPTTPLPMLPLQRLLQRATNAELRYTGSMKTRSQVIKQAKEEMLSKMERKPKK